ncbi:ion transport peptide [Calliopsis andreniformis]|uniref:ion transport peptide n=1 Tax=Calliopsis andreniformis TaxID=337506 RepID=UPI003FCEA5D9
MGDNDRRRAARSRVNFVIRYTMHRQQRLRSSSSSSSPSSLSLPFWTPRSFLPAISLSSTSMTTPTTTMTTTTTTSTSTSTSTLSSSSPPPSSFLPLPSSLSSSPSSFPSSLQPSANSSLPSSTTWSTSNLSGYSWNVQQTSCSRLCMLPTESSSVVSSASIPCPRLVSVLAWSVTLLLVSSCIGLTDAGILNGHPLGKRSFIDIQCKGIYDKSIFARLDRICEDCYNLFREPQLHQLCR